MTFVRFEEHIREKILNHILKELFVNHQTGLLFLSFFFLKDQGIDWSNVEYGEFCRQTAVNHLPKNSRTLPKFLRSRKKLGSHDALTWTYV